MTKRNKNPVHHQIGEYVTLCETDYTTMYRVVRVLNKNTLAIIDATIDEPLNHHHGVPVHTRCIRAPLLYQLKMFDDRTGMITRRT